MDDDEALKLIDAHLDRQPLTEGESDALSAWIKEDPKRADEAFSRIFLHSYLRLRLQAGELPETTELTVLKDTKFDVPIALRATTVAIDVPASRPLPRRSRSMALILSVCALFASGLFGLLHFLGVAPFGGPRNELYAYEGFEYPATVMPAPDFKGEVRWPTTGGMQDLAGGTGWSDAWAETNSKVAVIVDYHQKEMKWDQADMRKFGPLGYTDPKGNVLQSAGNQMRTATSPRSISTRQLNLSTFPESMKDELGIGRDGCVVWLSFLAQSSFSSAKNNRYSYLLIGSKSVAGLRIGKLGAAPSGNWTAVGLQEGAEVNLRSSSTASGEMAFFAARIIFRPGPEEVVVWINPRLDVEPAVNESSMHLMVPDFRFDGISINANHSTDFDEIRFGNTFRAVVPLR